MLESNCKMAFTMTPAENKLELTNVVNEAPLNPAIRSTIKDNEQFDFVVENKDKTTTEKTTLKDGEKDNYVDGFRALKELGYEGFVSFECGCEGDPKVVLPAAVELLRKQWDEA